VGDDGQALVTIAPHGSGGGEIVLSNAAGDEMAGSRRSRRSGRSWCDVPATRT
jgi:hypothetical protein